MSRLRYLTASAFTLSMIVSTGCTPHPEKITQAFLNDLLTQNYAGARRFADTGLKEQIAIVEQDKYALYNGQEWHYYNLNFKAFDDKAIISYSVRLNDGTKIDQTADLSNLEHKWLIRSIRNVKIHYAPGALKKRSYASSGDQMLIAPLDIEYISKQRLNAHIGEFIVVSGNLCEYKEQGNTLVMSMGADSSQPLLSVKIEGTAKARAIQDRANFLKIDHMVESPMGASFTAIGLLHLTNGCFSMKITNPENIITGQYLRIENNKQ
ncbi:hypothetical protein [uncultured Mucilaginibacter sp.]|uniref:hypothetical protein n=1 Tax=uncultured Mucilaginibacter sp. TaxID=797541 RepID=UPI0025FD9D1F|nr:hypothetical protein [uncultured Mucilaginibacter sp.]